MSKKACTDSLILGKTKFQLLEASTIHIMGLRPKPNVFCILSDQGQPQKKKIMNYPFSSFDPTCRHRRISKGKNLLRRFTPCLATWKHMNIFMKIWM